MMVGLSLRRDPQRLEADETECVHGGSEGILLSAVFDALRPRLVRIAAGMGFAPADVEDIAQEVSLRAARHCGAFAMERQAVAWLMRTTVNCCITEFRRRKRFQRAAKDIWHCRVRPGARRPEHEAIRKEEVARVHSAMRELKPDLLVPLVLRYFCDCHATQIAEMLSLKPVTVRSRLRDARLRLARALADEEALL